MFLGAPLGIQRYDIIKYPNIKTLTNQQLYYYWLPENEANLTQDSIDFNKLEPKAQHIFTANLKRQILLDSVQGRAPSLVFLPLVTLPEVETFINVWTFFEGIHSESYSYIIKNLYPDASTVFDSITSIEEIMVCASDISHYYDDLLKYSQYYNLLGPGTHQIKQFSDSNPITREITLTEYELKKKLWLTLLSVNVLEGLRFYVSFVCSWAFANNMQCMEGNAKLIKLIARDENLHLGFTQYLIRTLPKDDPIYSTIRRDTETEMLRIVDAAVEQEKQWAHYLFKDGGLIGLSEEILVSYIDYIADKRKYTIGLPNKYQMPSGRFRPNPIPWTESWISSRATQVAPQETEVTAYQVGNLKDDIDLEALSRDFTL